MLIGREKQQKILKEAYISAGSEFIVVYGRRRVGKTFLTKKVLGPKFNFDMIGIQGGSLKDQLETFSEKLAEYGFRTLHSQKPKTWRQAFTLLKQHLSVSRSKKKKIIFLDELPWLASHKSKFLSMLGYFWNDWAVDNNVLLVVCGSAASWMIKNILNNKGGLHNRVTQYISLQPFSLGETEKLLKTKNIKIDRYQVIQLYMALGGIPYYLELLKPNQSIPQNIDRLCFDVDGFLRDEFNRLFKSLFDKSESHVDIVKALASKWKGLTRNEIAKITGMSNSGNLTRKLDELEKSAFIQAYFPFDKKKKGKLYRLIDNFCLFYLKMISNRNLRNQKGVFLQLFSSQKYIAWCGYAFENTCFIHNYQIAKALGVSSIMHEFSSFNFKGDNTYNGIQIDLLIDRADSVINMCEVKFSNSDFILTPAYKKKLKERASIFTAITASRKTIFTTLITTYGLSKRDAHTDTIQNVVCMDDLF